MSAQTGLRAWRFYRDVTLPYLEQVRSRGQRRTGDDEEEARRQARLRTQAEERAYRARIEAFMASVPEDEHRVALEAILPITCVR